MIPKISIIAPVYKSEKLIHRCVNSILGQTYQDFELILVDDGSPDNSGKICDELAATDRRIRVIHQENQGAAAARNRGLECAAGEYIAFCDSDDMVAPRWLEHLLDAAAPDTLPMCTYCHSSAQLGEEQKFSIPTGEAMDRAEYFTFNRHGLAGYLCNGLYSNKIIREHSLRIRERKNQGDYNEDLLFALQYVRHVKHIVYTGYADYLYDAHEGSLSRNGKRYYFDKYAEKYQLWQAFLEEHHREDQLAQLANTYLYHFLTALNGESYRAFQKIVHSSAVQHCVHNAKNSAESPRIINLIKGKHTLLLWLTYKLHQLKGR